MRTEFLQPSCQEKEDEEEEEHLWANIISSEYLQVIWGHNTMFHMQN